MLSIDAGCLLSFQKAHLIISLGVRKLSFVRISAINIRNTFSERAKSTVCPLSAYNNICACSSWHSGCTSSPVASNRGSSDVSNNLNHYTINYSKQIVKQILNWIDIWENQTHLSSCADIVNMLSCSESCLRWPLRRLTFSEIGGPFSTDFHDEPAEDNCDSIAPFCDTHAATLKFARFNYSNKYQKKKM